MILYPNLRGGGDVLAYEIRPKSIVVRFTHGTYEYTNAQHGSWKVWQMKRLAARGKGLGSYISRHIRDGHEHKAS